MGCAEIRSGGMGGVGDNEDTLRSPIINDRRNLVEGACRCA